MSRIPLLSLSLCLSTTANAANWRHAPGFQDGGELASAIAHLENHDLDVAAWAVQPNGEWIVVGEDRSVAHSEAFDKEALTAVVLNQFFGRDIEAIDCNAANTCVVVHTMGVHATGPVHHKLAPTVNDWHNRGWSIRDVEITATGYLLLSEGGAAAYQNMPADLSAAIGDRRRSGRSIRDVSYDDSSGRWLLYADSHPMYQGLDAFARTYIDGGAWSRVSFDHVLLGPNDSFLTYDRGTAIWTPDMTDPVEAVEFGLGATGTTSIWQRMSEYGVAGMAIAVLDGGQVISARGYGTRTAGFQQPVLGNTPFDLASLSKYLGAVTTLAALEQYPTSLTLQTDLTSFAGLPTITTWLQRGAANPAAQGFQFIARPAMPAFTMQQLLSHTAAMSTGGSTPIPFYLADQTVTTEDYLSGWSCNTVTCGWSGNQTVWYDPTVGPNGFGGTPGGQYAYSSHGYLVAQAVVEDLAGMPVADVMEDLVFTPMGLSDTTAAWPWSSSYASRVASQHDDEGSLYRTYYPWAFAGGVMSSAEEYGELMGITLNDGMGPNRTRILSVGAARSIRQAQNLGTVVFSYGLGVDFDGTQGASSSNGEAFYHSGSHPGRANTYMCGRPQDGTGIVILMNTDDPNGTTSTFRNEILNAFVNASGWVGTNCF